MKREVDGDQPDSEPRGGSHGAGIAGAIALAAAVGLGVGLLAAPQAGGRTRDQLRRRIASLGQNLGESFEELEERSRPARRKLRKRAERAREDLEDRLDRLEHRDDHHPSGLMGLVTFAAGLAATYFLTSDRAAPIRAKAREAATKLRDRATDRWDRFQERRHANGGTAESGAQTEG
jgi:gas vesicle protein